MLTIALHTQNCSPPTGSSGREIVSRIRKHLASINTGTGPDQESLGPSGPLMSFKAYLELSSPEGVSAQQVNLRSELQGSVSVCAQVIAGRQDADSLTSLLLPQGVSLIDTPKSGRKDVADKMIIADIMAYAIDVPPPARIVLLSGDRDFAYPMSLIRGRGYQVVLITPPVGAVPILKASANHVSRWRQDVLGMDRDGFGRPYEMGPSTPHKRSSSPGPYNRSSSPGPYTRPVSPGGSNRSAPTNGTRAPSTPASSAATPAAAEMRVTSSLTGPGAGPVAPVFAPLVQALEECKAEGQPRPLRSKVAVKLTAIDKDIYEKAGAAAWRDYIAVAEAAGIVVLGSQGKTGTEWVALRTLSAPGSSASSANGASEAHADGFSVKSLPAPQQGVFVPSAGTKANAEATKTNTEVNAASTATSSARNGDTFNEAAVAEATFQIPESAYAPVRTDESVLAPPSAFIPLLRAVYAAEQVTQRSPPFTAVVGRCMELMLETGRIESPYEGQVEVSNTTVKRFGTYITAAYKARVAKLSPTEKPGVAALDVSPAFSNWLDALRNAGSQSSADGTSPPLSKKAAAAQPFVPARSSSPEKRAAPSTPSKTAQKTPSKSTIKATPSASTPSTAAAGSTTKKSAYLDENKVAAHSPSGVRIPIRFFPLANALLIQRGDGRFYVTDKVLHQIISKHKSVGAQYKQWAAFERYLGEAEQAGILSSEPGNQAGTRHVRLADKLRDPKEKAKGGEGAERLPVAGANPYDTSAEEPSSSSVGSGSEPSSSPVLGHARASSSLATSQPSLEDRKRFKPLMDALLALRRERGILDPTPSLVRLYMATKTVAVDLKGPEHQAWLRSVGASSVDDYLAQAQQFGFVTRGRKTDEEGTNRSFVRLGEKYERK